MAIDFTGTSIPGPTITGTTTSSGVASGALAAEVVKATFDKYIGMKLQSVPMYRRFATVRPVEVAHPGSSIDMYIDAGDLALATTPLSEYADPDSEALPAPVKVTAAPKEYGKKTVTSMRLRKFSWSNIDLHQADLVARNMRDTVDKLVEGVAFGATGGVSNGGFTKNHVNASGVLTAGSGADTQIGVLNAASARRIVAGFSAASVEPFEGGNYIALIHPDQSVDFREDTTAAGWRAAHAIAGSNDIFWDGSIGVYEGVEYVESPRIPTVAADADNDKQYKALFLGKEALAEAIVQEFGTVVIPQSDAFGRLMGLGWYGFADWCIYREEAGVVLATESTV